MADAIGIPGAPAPDFLAVGFIVEGEVVAAGDEDAAALTDGDGSGAGECFARFGDGI